MARITFSPLVAGASGKTADAVFSRWKGVSYVRKLVTPANPQTAAQTVVRDSLGRLPPLWRSLQSQIKAVQDTYGTANGISGYNWFVGANRVLEETYLTDAFTPPNVVIDRPLTITLTDQTGGVCKVDWTGGTQGANYFIYIISRKIATGDVETAFNLESNDSVLVSALTFNATLEASKQFMVSIAVEDTTNDLFSQSIGDTISMGA